MLVTKWFAHKCSLAMGIFMAAGEVGAFMAAPMSVLIESTGEWRFIWSVMGGADATLWVYASAIVFGLCFGLTVVATSTLIANFYGIRSNTNLMAIRGHDRDFTGSSGPVSAAYIADSTGTVTPLRFIIFMFVWPVWPHCLFLPCRYQGLALK